MATKAVKSVEKPKKKRGKPGKADVFTRVEEQVITNIDQIAAKWTPPLTRSQVIGLAMQRFVEANRHLLDHTHGSTT